MKKLELTGKEVGLLLMLAAIAEPDPKTTDPEIMAAHYKAKSVVTNDGKALTLNVSLSIRRSGR